jgi:hypothetical protein
MAGTEHKGQVGGQRGARREEEEVGRPRGAAGATRGSREQDDQREEDGWTQPESSAQKGALPDEG